ncbi:unnamed protein product [Brassica oleracea]
MYASQLSTLDHIQVSSHFKENIHQFLKCLTQRPQKLQERMSKNAGAEHNFSKSDPLNEDLLSNMDGYDDLEFNSSSQESFDSDTSDQEQSILLEPEINNQSERVMKLAAMFKKTFSEVKKKVKPISPKEDG